MSFFGGGKKSEPAPTPRPVTKKLAAATTPQQQATAAAEEVKGKKREVRAGAGKARRGTKLTGPRGLRDEAATSRKSLLGA